MSIPFHFLPKSKISDIIHVRVNECEELDESTKGASPPIPWIQSNPDKPHSLNSLFASPATIEFFSLIITDITNISWAFMAKEA